jgi:L-amino acid N-acyltransferase YncA
VEKDVRTTKLELTIDFVSLVNLELMFAYYDKPPVLAILFVSLGFCDLFWVANLLVERKAAGEVIPPRKWLAEKVVAILFYGASCGGIFWLSERVPALVLIGVLAVAFWLIRFVSFRQVRKIRGLAFREAGDADIPHIVRIHNMNVLAKDEGIDRVGFLLESTSEDAVRTSIADASGRYFVAVDPKSGGDVLGYVGTAKHIPKTILDHVHWKSPSEKNLVEGNRHVYIAHLAVLREYSRRGVGQFLYHHLQKVFPNAVFSVFVALRPHCNARSLTFHQKQGFKSAGFYFADQFGGLQDYESVLFVKDTWPKF